MSVFSFTCNDLHSNMATYISSTSIMTVYLLFAQAHTYTELAVPCYAQLNCTIIGIAEFVSFALCLEVGHMYVSLTEIKCMHWAF